MATKTPEQRKEEANQACRYMDSTGTYDVEYHENDTDEEDEECFRIIDENGEQYLVPFSEVSDDAKFYKLVEIE